MATYTRDEKLEILRRVPLFGALRGIDLRAISDIAGTQHLRRREELFHKGDSATRVHIVVSGRLKIITTSDRGDDLMFGIAGPGEVVGEIALLTEFASVHGRQQTSAEGGGVRIEVQLSQEEWGDLVGSSRESVNRQFRTWSDEGLISMRAGCVVIRDPETLMRLADSRVH